MKDIELNITNDEVLDLREIPTTGLRPIHLDQIADQLTELLGGNWMIGKVGGRFFIYDDEPRVATRRSAGEHASIFKAISAATGMGYIK